MNLIPGGKYHNFKDFTSFPNFERKYFLFEKKEPSAHPLLENQKSLLKVILKQDVLLHFPYQRFDYVVDILREAAIDPKVKSIKINVYRVAKHSQVMNALLNAISNGKDVTVVLELQARFDEENNVYWTNKLRENGAKVLHGLPQLKIHSKLIQITRLSKGKEQFITYIGTGNFNEKTSRIYGDLGLLTSETSISSEVKKVIKNEIDFAKRGKKGLIRLKINNLVDQEIIKLLYQASNAGVKIELIIRGICCLVPGVKKQSENIKVISIVDRYLEHARFMIFGNNGKPLYYLSSADWMERNLDKRIEVGCPILDKNIQQEIDLIFSFQWKGNNKARVIDRYQKNTYRAKTEVSWHSQMELYQYYKQLEDYIKNENSISSNTLDNPN